MRDRHPLPPKFAGTLPLPAQGLFRFSTDENQPRTYLLNQLIVRCQARSAAALL